MTHKENLPKERNPVLWATVFWPLMASHSGMRPLFSEIEALAPGFAQRIAPEPLRSDSVSIWKSRARRVLNPAPQWINVQREYPAYSETSWLLEQKIHDQVMRTSPSAVLLDALDDQFYLLAEKRASWPKTRMAGICHLPPAWWRLRPVKLLERFKSLDLLVSMTRCARPFWVSLLGEERVETIPYGVDTDFYCPDETEHKLSDDDGKLRAVFVGHTLRDFDTLAAIVTMVDQLDLPICFEMIVPTSARHTDACYRIAMHSRVRWHSGLSDESLRHIYRQSDLLLLILTDATANTALLEAMSCGLPVILTDVGAVREYARENFADFVRPRDAAHATEVLRSYAGQMDKLKLRGVAARKHATTHFSWKKLGGEYLTLLRRLIDTE